jgi:acyl-CoA synthetase (AMP-forming)/AMP-acid ligase II
LRAIVLDVDGECVRAGDSGELCIAGPAVMQGYWNLPQQTEAVFDVDEEGVRWYHTGDLVSEDVDGNFRFLGRKDRMVKRRGFRVELGEIESVLYRHPQIKEVAVVAKNDEERGVSIKAFLSSDQRPSIIVLKQFCTEKLPAYMVPDFFCVLEALPKTSTDKVDYEKLKSLA